MAVAEEVWGGQVKRGIPTINNRAEIDDVVCNQTQGWDRLVDGTAEEQQQHIHSVTKVREMSQPSPTSCCYYYGSGVPTATGGRPGAGNWQSDRINSTGHSEQKSLDLEVQSTVRVLCP